MGWNPRASAAEQWKLGRTRALLDVLGAPDRHLRVCLVAGTKGKGSTAAMLASILSCAGVRAGLYTQPHLQSYRERIRIDGHAISAAGLSAAVERVRAVTDRVPSEAGEPTTFEVTTALALDHFARQDCRVAVVEVGLGGRLDATNATDPEISVIASISYDHTAILGRTLARIAAEKAGILRPGRRGLIAHQRPAAARALRKSCRSVGAHCTVVDPWPQDVETLPGVHQRQNAGLAAAAARALYPIEDATIRRALGRLTWPGRFERIGRDLVLDGAHNGASAEALAATLREQAGGRPLVFVLGLNADKDARAVLAPLLALPVASVWVTAVVGNPRALPASALARVARHHTRVPVTALDDPTLALDQARSAAAARGALVCVTGSLALVGAARTALGLAVPERLW